MQVCQRNEFGVWRKLLRCKEFLKFEKENIDFLSAKFLSETDTSCGGSLSLINQMEVFYYLCWASSLLGEHGYWVILAREYLHVW